MGQSPDRTEWSVEGGHDPPGSVASRSHAGSVCSAFPGRVMARTGCSGLARCFQLVDAGGFRCRATGSRSDPWAQGSCTGKMVPRRLLIGKKPKAVKEGGGRFGVHYCPSMGGQFSFCWLWVAEFSRSRRQGYTTDSAEARTEGTPPRRWERRASSRYRRSLKQIPGRDAHDEDGGGHIALADRMDEFRLRHLVEQHVVRTTVISIPHGHRIELRAHRVLHLSRLGDQDPERGRSSSRWRPARRRARDQMRDLAQLVPAEGRNRPTKVASRKGRPFKPSMASGAPKMFADA